MNYIDEQLRRIDSLVATRIMGWELITVPILGGGINSFTRKPYSEYYKPRMIPAHEWNPTADHNACAEMRKRLHELTMMGLFIAELNRSLGIFEGITPAFGAAWAVMGTTPLQQCLAALAAVGVDVEKELKEIENENK